MPNWCSNEITIKTSALKETVEGLIINGKDEVDFDIVVPSPDFENGEGGISEEERSGIDEKIFPDWYIWRLYNWGTKWHSNECIIVTNEDKDETYITFSTAWSPPTPWFISLCERLKKDGVKGSIILEYLEPGNQIAGNISYLDGEYKGQTYEYGSPEYKALYKSNYGDDDLDDDVTLIDLSNINK